MACHLGNFSIYCKDSGATMLVSNIGGRAFRVSYGGSRQLPAAKFFDALLSIETVIPV